jgi:hypothetical protein
MLGMLDLYICNHSTAIAHMIEVNGLADNSAALTTDNYAIQEEINSVTSLIWLIFGELVWTR